MRVIGTAGHVDHGKSTLIAAITGVHPDRLKEEQAREMTIDLGFGWLTLPNGETVGIVDVPGHRDFIENMLAGVGGIDATLFVVAADEGVMPQTREHLAILDILQIPAGVVVLTKIDLVDDEEWLRLVEADVRQALKGTVLAEAPVLPVSARTRQGLDVLMSVLADVLAQLPTRPDFGRPRLPVDRVFTMPGFGTVVTGTLSDGLFRVGEEIEVLPQGLRGRIRGLQTHRQKVETAVPGSRTAINISGLDVSQIRRGNVVAYPGQYQPTRWLDVRFRLLPDAGSSLKHNSEVKLFLGSAEVLARVRLLGSEEIKPGESGWLQLELHEPVVAMRGDRYILRRPSPGETLGGGGVVDAHPSERHRRFSVRVLDHLEALSRGSPDEVTLQAIEASGFVICRELVSRTGLDAGAINEALYKLVSSGWIVPMESGEVKANSEVLIASSHAWEDARKRAVEALKAYHGHYPLRKGMPREELKSRLRLSNRVMSALMAKCEEEGILSEDGPLVYLPGHSIHFSPLQEEKVRALMQAFADAPYTPPSIKECQEAVGEEVYQALVDLGRLVPVSTDVVFRTEDYTSMVEDVKSWIEKNGTLTVAQFRDRYNTSRRYALAFLEHLDAKGMTMRDGDVRRLRR